MWRATSWHKTVLKQSWSERVQSQPVWFPASHKGSLCFALLLCQSGWSCCWLLLLLWLWPAVPPSPWKTWSSMPGNLSLVRALVRLFSFIKYSRYWLVCKDPVCKCAHSHILKSKVIHNMPSCSDVYGLYFVCQLMKANLLTGRVFIIYHWSFSSVLGRKVL